MKKLLAVLGMITCMVGLCACGSKEVNSQYSAEEQQSLLDSCSQTVEYMAQIVLSGDISAYADDEVIYGGLSGIQGSMQEIGTITEVKGEAVEFDNDGNATFTVHVTGSDHDAHVILITDNELSFTSITTNVVYSMGEIMTKAALNTVVGMGTVFVVLILLVFIIMSFGIIAKIDAKKNEKNKAAEAAPTGVVAQIIEKEELSDDTELVAVISAAIAAYEGAGSADNYVVRSIRKVNKSKWHNA